MDHFNNRNDATHVVSKNLIRQNAIIPTLVKPVLFRGAALTTTPFETNQVIALLRAEDTTYSYSAEKQQAISSGSKIVLVAATQVSNLPR